MVNDLDRPSLYSYLAYVLAALFLCYEMGLQASPSVMTHGLMKDLHIDAGALGIMASCYFFSYTFMQIPAGLLFDRFSTRLLITLSMLICVCGALLFGIAQTIYIAASGRFLMGIGSAFAFISVLVVAAKWFPTHYFASLVGFAQLLAAIGAIGGEVPLASAVTAFGWRNTILYIGFAGLIITLLVWLVIKDKPTINQITHKPQQSVLTSLKSILVNSQTWWVAFYAFCSWAPITAFAELWGIPYLMKVYGVSNTLAATAVAAIWIGLGIASPLIGWYSDLIGRRKVLLTACALLGLAVSLVILYVPHLPFAVMFILLFGFGIATAGQILTFAIVKENNHTAVTATAIGFNNMAVVAGGAIFQPLVGILLRWNWGGTLINGTPIYDISAYKIALLVVPLCFFIAWLVNVLFIQETYCKPRFS